MKKIYVIIPVFNGVAYTLNCLKSLEKVQVVNYKKEIIVVDNGSSDGTAKIIQKQFPQVFLIKNKKNLGFGRACNQGLRKALQDKEMKFVLLLNNDTVVSKTFLTSLIKTAESEEKIGIVAPCLRHYQKKQLLFGMEGHLDLKTGKASHRNLPKIKEQKIIQADFVSGCCMLVKRKVLEKAGLFDERFFLYLEDVDYCLKAKKAGFSVVLDPKVIIDHKVSGSSNNPLAKIPSSFKSNLILILKWTPIWYKPLAILHCLFFYPSLVVLWTWQLIKKKING